jgi:hypothetical protein
MLSYREQFNAMLAALAQGKGYLPPAKANSDLKTARYIRALRALQTRNLFVPAIGNYPPTVADPTLADGDSTYTTFTPPLNEDVIVCGCSLGNVVSNAVPDQGISGELRIRPPRALSANYINVTFAFTPASYSIYFPAPFILRASEQIAIDFGLNAPQTGSTFDPREQTIVFFCISVRSCLSSEDAALANELRAVIEASPYQRKIFLNCVSPNANQVQFSTPVAIGSTAISETRPISSPMLVLGIGTTFHSSKLSIVETAIQHSFTTGELINCRNLFTSTLAGGISLWAAGPYYSYFRFPVPHLLRPGATLACRHLNGLGGTGFDGGLGYPSDGTVLAFECLSL